jgi:phosphoglucosamine mutase
MTKLFGTDGIRGRAFEPPLDETTVRRLGAALADVLGSDCANPQILMAGDTRASTPELAEWLASAFQAAGGRVTWGDVLPTPAVSHLVGRGEFRAGVVISASHNPAHDNGIKILGSGGEKIDDERERRLEERITVVAAANGPGLPAVDNALRARYLDQLTAGHDNKQTLAGLRVVVDAANGAASGIARQVLERLGARVETIASEPDGQNINAGCGATAPELLAERVTASGADAGLALDGDADRAILVDEKGRIFDGDDILLAWARRLHDQSLLPGGTVVATVMSNLGLERTLRGEGMEMVRCPVGDRAVWLTMKKHRSALGGEQSGHIICSHHGVSGDGLTTGTQVLAIAVDQDLPVSELSRLERLPQVLLNVPVARKRPFENLPSVARELEEVNRQLEARGRVLLRYSGTEPLARVMIEGEDAGEINELAERLATSVRNELG